MTIADHIRDETRELITFQYTKNLLEKGFDDKFIADAFIRILIQSNIHRLVLAIKINRIPFYR
jgi:hypothetical protein